MPASDPTTELQRLQLETLHQLETIAADIRAGRLSPVEGKQRANALVAAGEDRRQALFAQSMAVADKRTRRSWGIVLAVVVAAAVVIGARLLAGTT